MQINLNYVLNIILKLCVIFKCVLTHIRQQYLFFFIKASCCQAAEINEVAKYSLFKADRLTNPKREAIASDE